MIIGIDESGTFSLESKKYSLFAGVHIPDNKGLVKLSNDFLLWKDKYKKIKIIKEK